MTDAKPIPEVPAALCGLRPGLTFPSLWAEPCKHARQSRLLLKLAKCGLWSPEHKSWHFRSLGRKE